MEDDREGKDNLWPQPFGWVLCLWDDHLLLYVCLAMLQEHLHQLMAILVIVQSHQLLLHLPQLLTAKVGGSDPFKEGADSGNVLHVMASWHEQRGSKLPHLHLQQLFCCLTAVLYSSCSASKHLFSPENILKQFSSSSHPARVFTREETFELIILATMSWIVVLPASWVSSLRQPAPTYTYPGPWSWRAGRWSKKISDF